MLFGVCLWAQVLGLPLTNFRTLAKGVNFSKAQVLQFLQENNNSFTELWELRISIGKSNRLLYALLPIVPSYC